jgi:hypothetical protein
MLGIGKIGKIFQNQWPQMGTFVLVVILSVTVKAERSAIDPLVDQFLETNREIAIEYFTVNLERSRYTLNCLSDQGPCDDLELDAGTVRNPAAFSFSKADFIAHIVAQYKAYRVIAGLANFQILAMSRRLNSGRSAEVAPVAGARKLNYNLNTPQGRQELDLIQSYYEDEVERIRLHNNWLQSQGRSEEMISHDGIEQHYKERVVELQSKYPFFASLRHKDLTEARLKGALRRLNRSYERTIRKISRLEGQDRYELLGFVDVFERTLQEFEPHEVDTLSQHFETIQENKTIWQKVMDVLKTPMTWVMVGCFTASIFILPVAPLLATICTSIGLGFAAKGLYSLGEASLRLHEYGRTGAFSDELFSRYFVNNLVTSAMYSIYFSAAIPSFTRNVANLRVNIAVAAWGTRESFGRVVEMSRSTLLEELNYFWRLSYFYGREFSLETVAERILSTRQLSRALLPSAVSTFLVMVDQQRQSEPGIIFLSELLEMSREAALSP